MKAISIWQPWASLIALGHKRIETRSWETRYRGPIAIQASKRISQAQREFGGVQRALGRLPASLPLGAVVAIAQLVDVRRTEELYYSVSALERSLGDFSIDRFGWVLENVVALEWTLPARGTQGLFDVPDEQLKAVLAKNTTSRKSRP